MSTTPNFVTDKALWVKAMQKACDYVNGLYARNRSIDAFEAGAAIDRFAERFYRNPETYGLI